MVSADFFCCKEFIVSKPNIHVFTDIIANWVCKQYILYWKLIFYYIEIIPLKYIVANEVCKLIYNDWKYKDS